MGEIVGTLLIRVGWALGLVDGKNVGGSVGGSVCVDDDAVGNAVVGDKVGIMDGVHMLARLHTHVHVHLSEVSSTRSSDEM